MKIEVDEFYDFNDSELIDILLANNNVIINVELWNNEIVQLSFNDVMYFNFDAYSTGFNIFEITSSYISLFNEIPENIKQSDNLKYFIAEDNDENCYLKVISKTLKITKIP